MQIELESKQTTAGLALTSSDILNAYRVAEFATVARDGSPVCWPLAPEYQNGRIAFSTGYVYPTKARNAQHNPRVAALFSDPTASGRTDNDPLVLVQGLAEVFDQDLQRNTERYVDQLLRKGPLPFRMMVSTPGLRQLLVGYLARIWIEVSPRQEYVWGRSQTIPEPLRRAIRPATFSAGAGIQLPQALFAWLPRYTLPPVLAYIDQSGWPAVTRVQAEVRPGQIAIKSDVELSAGAPVSLTYHRLVGNYQANDAFLIRGHIDSAGILIPEKIVGFGGTQDDRGVGSLKLMLVLIGYRKLLVAQMEKETRPLPVVRSKPRK